LSTNGKLWYGIIIDIYKKGITGKMKIVVRYIDIYRKDITGKMAEFAAKKYRSHRHAI